MTPPDAPAQATGLRIASASFAAGTGASVRPAALHWAGILAALVLGAWLLRLATFAHAGAGLYVDEAQYWWWSRDLAWGYFSKPPAIAVLIAASTSLFGNGLLGVKALAMLCYPLAGAALFGLGRDIAGPVRGPVTGLWAAAIFLASPLVGLLGLSATTDAPLLLLWALALWAAWRAVVTERRWAWWGLAAALGAGLLAKYTTAALMPGVLWFAWRHGDRAALWRAVAALVVAALLFAPHLAWNAAWGWPTLGHTIASTDGSTAGSSSAASRAAILMLAQLVAIGPVAIALAWRGESVARPRAKATRDLLLAGTVALLGAGLLQAMRGRIEVNWLAPVHLAFALALALRAPQPGSARVRTWILGLGSQAMLLTALALLPAIVATLNPGHWPPTALDAWARMRGWDPALAQLEPAVAAHPHAVLVASSRQAYAQALYAWRDHGLRPAGFNPTGAIDHHFAMRCPWRVASHLDGPFLLLTEGPPAPALLAAFEHVEELGQASAARAAGQRVALELRLATGPKPVPAGTSTTSTTSTRGDCR